jgi:hypothetical protein
MKLKSLICIALAALMLTGCTQTPDTTTTATTTTAPVTTPAPTEHLHLEEGTAFPASFNLEDEEATERLFDMCEILDGVIVKVRPKSKTITLSAKVNGKKFTLNVNLSGSNGNTTPEQIVTCAKLFWYCYPQMYVRFAAKTTPTTVTLKFEDFGYEVASASGNEVHIHDKWLKNNPEDFDCLTHEFSHIMQGGWDGNWLPTSGEDTYMIERFADYCRYLYSFKRGYYNDMCWSLQTSQTENSYVKGVRFWVWLDYTYSTKDIDIIARMQKEITEKNFPRADWENDGKAWDVIFEGTGALDKTLDELWSEYIASDLDTPTTKPREQGGRNALEGKAPLRQSIRDRYPEADDYLKVK